MALVVDVTRGRLKPFLWGKSPLSFHLNLLCGVSILRLMLVWNLHRSRFRKNRQQKQDRKAVYNHWDHANECQCHTRRLLRRTNEALQADLAQERHRMSWTEHEWLKCP